MTDQTQSAPRSGWSDLGAAGHLLRVLRSPDARRHGELREIGDGVVIGRKAANPGWRFADGRMSATHARLVRSDAGDCLLIEDLGAKNGLQVGGLQVRRRALQAGDIVRTGDTIFVYERATAPDPAEAGPSGLVAVASATCGLVARVRQAASTDLAILLQGESGTGKEVFARLIHRLSGRTGSFQALNCGALPAGLVESALFGHRKGSFTGATEQKGHVVAAHRGTLFLDEVAELSSQAQVALLRTLEEREVIPVGATSPIAVDIRVVSATHSDLDEAVDAGRFRLDLLARLAEWRLQVPGLRERRADIPALVDDTLSPGAFSRFSPDAAEALLLWDWPMNVRELRAVVRRAAAIAGSGLVRLACLPEPIGLPVGRRAQGADAPRGAVTRPPREAFIVCFDRLQGNVTAVAAHYGKDRTQIYRWMRHYGVERTS